MIITSKQRAMFSDNRPFARSGHMVQNHTCWWASCTAGLPKQSNSYQSTLTCLCFGSPTAQLAHQHVRFCTMWSDRAKGLLCWLSTLLSVFTYFVFLLVNHGDSPGGETRSFSWWAQCILQSDYCATISAGQTGDSDEEEIMKIEVIKNLTAEMLFFSFNFPNNFKMNISLFIVSSLEYISSLSPRI